MPLLLPGAAPGDGPIMLVGTAGTGKSVLVEAKLASLDPEAYLVKNIALQLLHHISHAAG